MKIRLNLLIKSICVSLLILDNAKGIHAVTQSHCWYKDDGEVQLCYNVTKLDKKLLGGPITVKSNNRIIFNVSLTDVIDFYRLCHYDWFNNQSDICIEEVALPFDTGVWYLVCGNEYIINNTIQRDHCMSITPSFHCDNTQPSTNRILHQSIPPTVYMTGIVFNILILCVLNYKTENTVTNILLKMLSVWDLLYLGSMLLESCIGRYTDQFLIKDVSYAWAYIKYYAFQFNSLRGNFEEFDTNIRVSTWSYYIMYWVHLAALVFQIASVYQTVVIATFRCIAIRRPFQAAQMLTQRKAAVASACCLLLGVSLHVPSFLAAVSLPGAINCEIKYHSNYDREEYKQCKTSITSSNPLFTVLDEDFLNFFHIYHIILYTIILFLALPFLMLLILNTLLLKALYTESSTPHDEENKAVTKVVITIVFIFLLTYIVMPAYSVDFYYFKGSLMNSVALSSCGRYFTVSLIVIILPTLNSVVNLLVYLGLRKTFRQQFIAMFSCLIGNADGEKTEVVELHSQ